MSYEVDNLDIKIKASADEGILAMDKLLKVSEKVSTVIDKLSVNVDKANTSYTNLLKTTGQLKETDEQLVSSFRNMSTEASKAKREVSDLNRELDKISNKKTSSSTATEGLSSTKQPFGMSDVFSLAKVVALGKAVKGLVNVTVGGAIEMTENMNLFNVAMGNSVEKGNEFQRTLSNSLNINISESTKYQGFFMSLSRNMNIASDSAYKMSENLTKLIYDLSSLYNIDVDKAYSKLQSGMIGQTKPMRELGIDITAQTLQGYINDFGWDTQIQQLTQAEKVMLRYIAIIDQSKLAHGDMAMTLNAPANQLRQFNQLLRETSMWLGTVFLGALSNVMVYINAFLVGLKSVAQLLSSIFGFKPQNFGLGNSRTPIEIGGVASGLDNVGNSLGKVGKQAKETKKQMLGLLGFEEIHNISTPQEPTVAGGGVGGGGGGGGMPLGNGSYYDDLVSKLSEYDNMMSGVNDKAKQIALKMLDWLGFTARINSETGEIEILWKGLWDLIKNMSTSAKLLIGIPLAIWSTKIGKSFLNFLPKFVLKDMKNLFEITGLYTKLAGGNLVKGITAGTGAWFKQLSTTKQLLIGVTALVGGMALASSGARDFARDGELTVKSTTKMVGGFASATAGGAALGFTLGGPVGAGIGAVTGFLFAGVSALVSYNQELKRVAVEAKLFDGYGVPIQDYTRQVVKSMESVTEASAETVKWIDAHNESKEALKGVTGDLDTFYAKLNSDIYDITAKDVENLNTTLDKMSVEVQKSGEAIVTASILMTDKMLKEGTMAQETADAVVNAAQRKMEAEGKAAEAYAIGLKDLDKKLRDGIITQDEYRVQANKLRQEFENTTDVLDGMTTEFEMLDIKQKRALDAKNWTDYEFAINDVSKTVQKHGGIVDDNLSKNLSLIDDLIRAEERNMEVIKKEQGVHSEAYRNSSKEVGELKKAKSSAADSAEMDYKRIEKSALDAYTVMLENLISTGARSTKEGKKISDEIADELSKMGYSVDFKTGIISTMNAETPDVVRQFETMGDKSGKAMTRSATNQMYGIPTYARNNPVKFDANVNTQPAYSSFWSLTNDINKTKVNVTVGMKSDGRGLDFKGSGSLMGVAMGRLSLSPYAKGGLPDVGEMFIARENGPEMVGTMGQKTAVANNNQIVSSVSKGVAEAVTRVLMGGNKETGTQTINLQLPNGDRFASWVIDEIDNLALNSGKTFRTV